MTPYKLTVDAEAMQGLFTRDDALAGVVEQIMQQVLEAQVTDYLQAQPYERTTERRGYRNGFKPRQLTTRVGAGATGASDTAGGVLHRMIQEYRYAI